MTFDRAIAELASGRYGVLLRREVVALGATQRMIHRRLESRIWERLDQGVYRLASHPVTWHQRLLAACMSCGGVASHRAACALWELPDFAQDIIELSVPASRSRPYPGAVLHRVRRWGPADRTEHQRIPVTSVARTLVDLAAVVHRDVAEEALDHALKRRMVSLRQMRWQLEHSGKRPGTAVLRALLRRRDPRLAPPENVLETRTFRILRGGGIRGLVTQHEVRTLDGKLRRIDFAIPRAKIAIEADGSTWHDGLVDRARDAERDNALSAIGWLVLRFGWDDLDRPAHVLDTVERVIAQRPQPS